VWLASSQAFQLNDTTGCGSGFESPKTKISKGSWHFFVGIIDTIKSQKAVYIDGILKAKVTYNNIGLISSAGEMRIGWTTETHSAYSYFNGAMDEIRLYNRVLTPAEISGLYYQGVPVNGTIKSLGSHTVTCTNTTAAQTITIPASTATAYDCEAKGLKVNPQDNVTITINGNVQ
jgi:hypothetical protein